MICQQKPASCNKQSVDTKLEDYSKYIGYEDTVANDKTELVKKKTLFAINKGLADGKTCFINGGWQGVEYGYTEISRNGDRYYVKFHGNTFVIVGFYNSATSSVGLAKKLATDWEETPVDYTFNSVGTTLKDIKSMTNTNYTEVLIVTNCGNVHFHKVKNYTYQFSGGLYSYLANTYNSAFELAYDFNAKILRGRQTLKETNAGYVTVYAILGR